MGWGTLPQAGFADQDGTNSHNARMPNYLSSTRRVLAGMPSLEASAAQSRSA